MEPAMVSNYVRVSYQCKHTDTYGALCMAYLSDDLFTVGLALGRHLDMYTLLSTLPRYIFLCTKTKCRRGSQFGEYMNKRLPTKM
jgi:hypothetical protein